MDKIAEGVAKTLEGLASVSGKLGSAVAGMERARSMLPSHRVRNPDGSETDVFQSLHDEYARKIEHMRAQQRERLLAVGREMKRR